LADRKIGGLIILCCAYFYKLFQLFIYKNGKINQWQSSSKKSGYRKPNFQR
jgi:hypothetical protein